MTPRLARLIPGVREPINVRFQGQSRNHVLALSFSGFGPIAEVVGFKGARRKPLYRSVAPLDARRLPTFN